MSAQTQRRGKKNPGAYIVISCSKLAKNSIKDYSATQGEHAGDVLNEQCFWLKLIQKPDVVLEKAIARVGEEAFRRVN